MNTVSKSLRIAVDGRVLVMQPTGIGRYTRSLFGEMARQYGADLQAVFFTHKPITDTSFWPGEFKQEIVPFPSSMLLRPVWERFFLPPAMGKKGPFDLYFSPLSAVPPNLKIPSVATVHDLAFMFFPEILPWNYRFYWKRAVRTAAARAEALIAVSESTRNDLTRLFPDCSEKIAVVHEAPEPSFLESTEERFSPGSSSEIDPARLGKYLLAVGTLEPRKNYPFLFEVMEELVKKPGLEDLCLVLVGGKGWRCEAIEEAMKPMPHWLKPMDYVPHDMLPPLYRNALALVVPSLYEGFGLPAIEAMALGTPVVASNVSSLPEVVGPGGILLPLEKHAWVWHLAQLVSDSALRSCLSIKAKEQSKEFSWERAAQETWEVFRKAARTESLRK